MDPDNDRSEWDRAWAAAPHRRLNDLANFNWKGLTDFDLGRIVDATFVEVPSEYFGSLFIASETCPSCGQIVDDLNCRVDVGLSPTFERPPKLGFGVWMHIDCVNACQQIDEPNPIPW